MTNKEALYFITGIGIGALATYYSLRNKYEKKLSEDLEKTRKELRNIYNKPVKNEPESFLEKLGYINHEEKLKEEYAESDTGSIYTISPSDFGEDDHGRVELMYYTDGVLVDNEDNSVLDEGDIENTVGKNFADFFGDYEDDAAYIRNDDRNCDYIILKSLKSYKEASDDNPAAYYDGGLN